jgi:hypothetical protein
MMDDNELKAALRSAFPPPPDPWPSRDLWPRVVDRIQSRPAPGWIDLALAALVAMVLVIFPEWLFVLAYHL